jgi:hypothetical protein
LQMVCHIDFGFEFRKSCWTPFYRWLRRNQLQLISTPYGYQKGTTSNKLYFGLTARLNNESTARVEILSLWRC